MYLSELLMADIENDLLLLSRFIQENNVKVLDSDFTIPRSIDKLLTEERVPEDGFYIVNLGEVIRRVKLWRELFPYIIPHYAIKSNPNKVVIELLAQLGVNFDVASITEINLVKDLVDMSRIIYANPVKKSSSIKYARTVDVDYLVVDSKDELLKIALYHPDAKVFIRLKVDDSGSVMKFSSKFGVDIQDLTELLNIAKSNDVDIIGYSWHCGSMCKDPLQYYNALKMTKDAFMIAKKIGFECYIIDIGGGFPGDNSEESMELLKRISEEVHRGINDFFSEYNIKHTDVDSDSIQEDTDVTNKLETDHNEQKPLLSIISEPGRYFSTSSHTLVVSVIGRKYEIDKNTGNKIFKYTIDEGLYQSFGCITYDHQTPQFLPFNNNDEKKYNSIIFGSTCDSCDVVCNKLMLPELANEDRLYIPNFGAYTVASRSNFNGFTDLKTFYVLY